MKKILLIAIAVMLTFKPFTQDIEKIMINYTHSDIFNKSGNVNAIQLVNQQPLKKNTGTEYSTRIIDIKNMRVTFYTEIVDTVVLDIVKYEKLDNGIIHIVCDERNVLFTEEENVRIFTNTYIDLKNNFCVYSWVWGEEDFAETYASKTVDAEINIVTAKTANISKIVEDSMEVQESEALVKSLKELSTCSEEYQKWFSKHFTFQRGKMKFRTEPIPPAPPKY
ncbi:MAG: hypothetical protein P8I93_04180 [Crocinitomicaceae bacterium]|nr:hypothetical protein [Crocinitomicaceae bacterium]